MVEQVIDKFGKVDILVNNAAIINKTEGILNIPEEEWDRVLDINLKGEFLCCQAVVPHMRKKRDTGAWYQFVNHFVQIIDGKGMATEMGM